MPQPQQEEIEQGIREIIAVGRRLYQQGLLAGIEGNISRKLSDGSLLITASGTCKGFLTPEMILHISMPGSPDEGVEQAAMGTADSRTVRWRPSSETALHLAAYAHTATGAVVHAHPPFASAFSLLKTSMPLQAMPEAVAYVGPIARVPYAVPGTEELARAFAPYWREHRSFIMERHGVLCLGADIDDASYRLESLERYAQIVYLASRVETVADLSRDQIEQLRR